MEREDFIEKLKEISALVDDNEAVMESLKEIQEGVLPWLDAPREERDDWKEKYEELKKKYRDRFFSGEVIEEEEPVEEEEKEEITIDDLFEEGK